MFAVWSIPERFRGKLLALGRYTNLSSFYLYLLYGICHGQPVYQIWRAYTHSADTEGSQNFKTWSRFYAKIEFCIFLKKIKIKIRKRPICINFFHMLFACKVRNNWDLMYDLCYAGFTFSYGHKWAKSFVTVLVTAETDCSLKTDCSLTVPVMAVSGKTTSSQSLYKMTIKMLIAFVI